MTFFSLIEIGKIARNTLKHNSDYINHFSLPIFFTSTHTYTYPHNYTHTYSHKLHTSFLSSFPFSLILIFFAPCPLSLPITLSHSISFFLTHPAYSNSYTHIPSRMAICHFDRKTSGGLY